MRSNCSVSGVNIYMLNILIYYRNVDAFTIKLINLHRKCTNLKIVQIM